MRNEPHRCGSLEVDREEGFSGDVLTRIAELRALTHAVASRITAGDSYIDVPCSRIGNVICFGDAARRDGTTRGAIAAY